MKNNRGFAISSILYTLLLIAGLFLVAILASSSFRLKLLSSKLAAVKNEVSGEKARQYRYITENGNWSEWIDYNNKTEIDYYFPISSIPNFGSKNSIYNLTADNVYLSIVDGVASVQFNGTNAKANRTSSYSSTVYPNTIYIEEKGATASSYLFSLGANHQISFDSSNRFYIRNIISSFSTTSVGTYNNISINRFVLTLNKGTGVYNIYENGLLIDKLSATDTEIMSFTDLSMGYNKVSSNGYFTGNIYKAVFSSMLIEPATAVNLSKYSDTSKMFKGTNSEVIYGDFIEYRDVSIDKRADNSNEEFSARYIKDTTAGSTTDTNNYYNEIEAYANFSSKQQLNKISIGGSHNASYFVEGLNKLIIDSGTYTSREGKKYILNTAMSISLPYTVSTSYGSNLIAFIDGDLNSIPFVGFKAINYMDKLNDGVFGWYYYNGSAWTAFTPNSKTNIVGYVIKKYGSISLDNYQLFKYPFNYNVALGAKINSSNSNTDINLRNIAIVNDGLTSTSFVNGTNSQFVELDLGCDYSITNVVINRSSGYTFKNAKTSISNYDRSATYTLFDSKLSGVYKEISIGNNFYVDKGRNPKTFRTRYINDAVNGFVFRPIAAGVLPIVQNSAYWSEIKAEDFNGNNIASGKTAVASNGTTGITELTNSMTTVYYTYGNDAQWVEIDLSIEYAVAAVQIWHYNEGGLNYNRYQYNQQKTILYDYGKTELNTIYNYKRNDVYIELPTGFRIPII